MLVTIVITAGFYILLNVFINWRWNTYGQNDALTWVSLFFTFIIAIVALVSLKITRDSLELTRATTRPFLNVFRIGLDWSRNDGTPTPVNYFVIQIRNEGISPANQVSVGLSVSKTDRDNQKHLFMVEGETPSICFPSEEIQNLMFREAAENEKLTVTLNGKLKVQIEINYQNKLTQKIHKTMRSYLVQYSPTATSEPTPIVAEDYWD